MAGGGERGPGVRRSGDRTGRSGCSGPPPGCAEAAAYPQLGVPSATGAVAGTLESAGAPWAGNPGSRAAGRHHLSPALCALVPLRGGVTDGRPAALATGLLSPGRGARWAQARPEKGGHGPRSRRLLGSLQAAMRVAGQAAAAPASPGAAEGFNIQAQEGAPPAEGALSQEPGAGTVWGLGQWLLCCVPGTGARGAPTPTGGVLGPLGTWRRQPHLLGHLTGSPTLPGPRCLELNVPRCTGCVHLRRRRSPDFFLAPGPCHSRQGSAWDPLLPGDHRLDEWSGVPCPASHSAHLCLAVCVPRRLALCSVHARILSQRHRRAHG